MLLSFLKSKQSKQDQSLRQLEFATERSERAFQVALEHERNGHPDKAEHFYRVAIGEEAKAFK